MFNSMAPCTKISTILALILVTLAASTVTFSSGCGGLAAVIFTSRFCDIPGRCGASGHILFSFGSGVAEFVPELGSRGGFVNPSSATTVTGGLAFADTPQGLRLYLATSQGLHEYDGRVAYQLVNTVPVPNCELMGDVVVLDDGRIVVGCYDSNRLLKIDPESSSIVAGFSCCPGVEGSFDPPGQTSSPLRAAAEIQRLEGGEDIEEFKGPVVEERVPFAIAVAPDGSVLAGKTQINRFDGETGDFLDVAVETGVMGATSYDDFDFGPNGNLFVSANPSIGVLEFDGATFEFLGVFANGNIVSPRCNDSCTFLGDNGLCEDGGPNADYSLCNLGTDCSDCGPREPQEVIHFPGALAFSKEGNLFVNVLEGSQLLEFDGVTGDLLTEVIRDESSSRILFIAFRP